MKKLLATILLISTASPLMADSISLDFGIYTKHIKSEKWMNEDNELISLEYKIADHGINYTRFVNTYGNDSQALGGLYNIYNNGYIYVDGLYGVVKGYTNDQLDLTECINDYCLYIAPRISLELPITKKLKSKTSVILFGEALEITTGFKYEF